MTTDLRETAQANLQFIRGAMERAERNSTVSGIAVMTMGVTALLASAFAAGQAEISDQLLIWVFAAVIASVVGGVGAWWKSRQAQSSLITDAARRFLVCVLPALFAGALLSAALWHTAQITVLPMIWMLLYGCGLTAAGNYAAQPVLPMGLAFLVCGALCPLLPVGWSNALLALTFGGLHLVAGYQVYRRHGG